MTPAVVAGHSLGELTALRLAGALDDETFFRLAAVRGRLMASSDSNRGAMASLVDASLALTTSGLSNTIAKLMMLASMAMLPRCAPLSRAGRLADGDDVASDFGRVKPAPHLGQ